MAEKSYEIRVKISADGARAEVVGVRNELERIHSTTGNVSGSFDRITGQLGGIFDKVSAIGRSLTLWGGVTLGAVGAIGFMGAKSAEMLERTTIGLEAVYGSAEKAREVTAALTDLGTKGPFGLVDIINLGTGLSMLDDYFKKSENLDSSILLFEDFAAGVSATTGRTLNDSLDLVRRQLPKFLMGGAAGELREQLPIIPWEKIKKEGGGTVEGMLEALRKYMPESWAGLTEKMGNTFAAKWSNLVGKFQIMMARALTPLLEKITAFIDKLTAAGAIDILAEIFAKVADNVGKILEYLGPLILQFLEWVNKSETVKEIFAWIVMLGPPLLIVAGLFLQIVGALGSMAIGVAGMATMWEVIVAVIGILFGLLMTLGEIVATILTIIAVVNRLREPLERVFNFLRPALEFVTGALLILWDIAKAVFTAIIGGVLTVAGAFYKIGAAIVDAAIKPLRQFFDMLGALVDAIPADSPLKRAFSDMANWVGNVRERGRGIFEGGPKGATQGRGGTAAPALPGLGFGGGPGLGGFGGLAPAAAGPVAAPVKGGDVFNITIPGLTINAQKVDEKSFMDIVGKLVTREKPS